MRIVTVTAKTEEDPSVFWDKIIDVKNWDKLIKFVKKIHINEQIKEGSVFSDTTTIFWIPVKIKHKITKIEKYKKFYMEAHMPLNSGIMLQTIDINKQNNFSIINIEIKFTLYFFLSDLIFGPILEKRLKQMIVATLNKLRDDLDGEIINE